MAKALSAWDEIVRRLYGETRVWLVMAQLCLIPSKVKRDRHAKGLFTDYWTVLLVAFKTSTDHPEDL